MKEAAVLQLDGSGTQSGSGERGCRTRMLTSVNVKKCENKEQNSSMLSSAHDLHWLATRSFTFVAGLSCGQAVMISYFPEPQAPLGLTFLTNLPSE